MSATCAGGFHNGYITEFLNRRVRRKRSIHPHRPDQQWRTDGGILLSSSQPQERRRSEADSVGARELLGESEQCRTAVREEGFAGASNCGIFAPQRMDFS